MKRIYVVDRHLGNEKWRVGLKIDQKTGSRPDIFNKNGWTDGLTY